MITNKMTTIEAVAVVENFVKEYIAWEKRYDEKSELEKVLPKISSKLAADVIKKEIDKIEEESDSIFEKHQLIMEQFVKYVFTNDFRKNLMTIETHFDTQSYRNSNGGYDDFFYFDFTGQLGKPLYSLMTLCSAYEFWGVGRTVPKEKLLTNKMSHKKFVDVVNKFYIGQGEPLS